MNAVSCTRAGCAGNAGFNINAAADNVLPLLLSEQEGNKLRMMAVNTVHAESASLPCCKSYACLSLGSEWRVLPVAWLCSWMACRRSRPHKNPRCVTHVACCFLNEAEACFPLGSEWRALLCMAVLVNGLQTQQTKQDIKVCHTALVVF